MIRNKFHNKFMVRNKIFKYFRDFFSLCFNYKRIKTKINTELFNNITLIINL